MEETKVLGLSKISLMGISVSLHPVPGNALSFQNQQIRGKASDCVTVDEEEGAGGQWKHSSDFEQQHNPVGLKILRLNDDNILHQNNKRNHSLKGVTKESGTRYKAVTTISGSASPDRNEVWAFLKNGISTLFGFCICFEIPFGTQMLTST